MRSSFLHHVIVRKTQVSITIETLSICRSVSVCHIIAVTRCRIVVFPGCALVHVRIYLAVRLSIFIHAAIPDTRPSKSSWCFRNTCFCGRIIVWSCSIPASAGNPAEYERSGVDVTDAVSDFRVVGPVISRGNRRGCAYVQCSIIGRPESQLTPSRYSYITRAGRRQEQQVRIVRIPWEKR